MRTVHPIEVESYRILRSLVDTSTLPPLTRAVLERIVHTTADLDFRTDLITSEEDLAAGRTALLAGAPVVTDVTMVAAGITRRDLIGEVVCKVADPDAARLAARTGLTRSAAGVRLAFEQVGPGAVWVVGNAPTALFELIELKVRPALVVGLPVGFVGAAESKAALRASGLPQLSNVSAKGGSPLAAAAVNALLYTDLYSTDLYSTDLVSTEPPGTGTPTSSPGTGTFSSPGTGTSGTSTFITEPSVDSGESE